MAVMGYLDNLSFFEQSDAYSAKKGINRALTRFAQEEFFNKLFSERNIPYNGPRIEHGIPLGGWFFKLGPPSTENLKKYVLGQLGVDDSLRTNLPQEEYNDFTVELGFLVRNYPDDMNPQSIDLYRGIGIEFVECLSAFQRLRGREYDQPYFLIIDREFVKKFLH